MQTTVRIAALVLVSAAVGCGGMDDDADASIPAWDAVSMDMTEADAAEPAEAPGAYDSTEDALESDSCHPHLFQRSRDVVRMTNSAVHRLLRPLHETAGLRDGGKVRDAKLAN